MNVPEQFLLGRVRALISYGDNGILLFGLVKR
jgi:hypothetical protein